MPKLGTKIPTMIVTSKVEKTGTPMKINEADFNPKIHAKIGEPKAEPEVETKVEPKAKPKPK